MEAKQNIEHADLQLTDEVVEINRVTKVVKGGKNLSFSALVVVGDPEKHVVGFAKGKAKEVPSAIRKAIEKAKKNLIQVNVLGPTIPHEVLGVWAWEGEGEAGAFWSRSPSVPPVDFGPAFPTGSAVYEGDAAGVLAAAGTATKFVAGVRLEADFADGTVGGAVSGFRSLAGAALDDLSVTLDEAGFAGDGAPFAGETSAGGTAGSGKWGGRWSDGAGRAMGGTFGFAADDSSLAVLGAFTACACASEAPGE